MMKVSVIICTYSMNRYGSFSEVIKGVLNQTYEPLEVVLVVNFSNACARTLSEEKVVAVRRR